MPSNFNPRAPCGARRGRLVIAGAGSDISIHAPHAGRDAASTGSEGAASTISIHAPHAGRDGKIQERYFKQARFQSTRPMRGATAENRAGGPGGFISIHAPHAGRDGDLRGVVFFDRYFNPRAPCGARQQKYTKLLYTLLRQKAILRQFHAKRRLLKRFSTYKYRNTFLICSANRMGKICTLPLRTTRSLDLPEGMSACSQSARFCFRTFFPSSKTADYPAPDP